MTDDAAASTPLWPLYAGGFLGPFGGAMVTPMLPELRSDLGTTLEVIAWSLTAYLIPFATLMLVSGTLAERWGRRRTVRGAYLLYAVSSVACALSTEVGPFLAGRAVQGAANAFTTPILVAAISDLVPPDRLGRSLGRYGSLQAAGQSFAPLVGGLAASVTWHLAFLASAVTAVALALVPPPDAPPPGHGAPRVSRWRSLANARLVLACGVALLLYLTSLGTTFLVALLAGDRFGLGPDTRGLVVAAFGAAGLVTGSRLGSALDRAGLRLLGTSALTALAVAVALMGVTPSLAVLVALVATAGAAATAGRVVVTTLAVTSTPANRSGAASMMLAWQFLGGGLAPLLWLPVYQASAAAGLLAAASGAAVAALVVLVAAPTAAQTPTAGSTRTVTPAVSPPAAPPGPT